MQALSPETVRFLIVKAREFDAKEGIVESDPASNPTDDGFVGVLEDHADDPTYQELRQIIDDMSEDEQIELVALVWLGRGDYGPEDWQEGIRLARSRRLGRTCDYLLGTPLLGDYLAEGLAALGHSGIGEETPERI